MDNRWMSGVLQTFSVLSFGTDAKPNWLRPSLASWLSEVNRRIYKTMPSEIWSNKIGQATFCLRSKPLMGGSRSALALSRARLVTDAASARRMSELFASWLWHIMCPGVRSWFCCCTVLSLQGCYANKCQTSLIDPVYGLEKLLEAAGTCEAKSKRSPFGHCTWVMSSHLNFKWAANVTSLPLCPSTCDCPTCLRAAIPGPSGYSLTSIWKTMTQS